MTQSSAEILTTALTKEGFDVTPSAAELLGSTPLSVEELLSGIKDQFPDVEEVTVRVAVDVVRSWPSWHGVSGKPLIDENKFSSVSQTRWNTIKHVILII